MRLANIPRLPVRCQSAVTSTILLNVTSGHRRIREPLYKGVVELHPAYGIGSNVYPYRRIATISPNHYVSFCTQSHP